MPIKVLIFIYFIFYLMKLLPHLHKMDQNIYVNVLDIGQGDAILITTPGNKHILIDGGPDFEVDNFIFNETPLNCFIDVIVLTHPHKDHVNGLNRVLDRCSVGIIFFNSIVYESRDFKSFMDRAAHLNAFPLYAGQKFTLDGVDFYALWPEKSFLATPVSNVNLVSLVLLMDYQELEGVFMGDLENPLISEMLTSKALKNIDGRLEFYKISHHGSSNGLNTRFMNYLNPQVAVLSAGEGNSYHHPHTQVLNFFQTLDTKLYRTDQDGTITVNLNHLPK